MFYFRRVVLEQDAFDSIEAFKKALRSAAPIVISIDIGFTNPMLKKYFQFLISESGDRLFKVAEYLGYHQEQDVWVLSSSVS